MQSEPPIATRPSAHAQPAAEQTPSRLSSDIFVFTPLPPVLSKIAIESDATIRTIGGNTQNIIFSIDGGNLTLNRIVLSHAVNTSSRGSAIRMTAGRAELTNVSIVDNYTDKGGGAIRVGKGALTCSNCVISRNSGSHGGAIWVGEGGTLVLNDCLLEHNVATYGGAIFNKGGTVTLTGTTIGQSGMSNTADQGGGIFSLDGKLTLQNDSNILHNRANTYGGGLVVVRGQLHILGDNANDIKSNSAAYGGGVFLQDTSAQILGATFSDNSAAQLGNDLMATGSKVTISPSVSISAEGQYYFD